MDDQEQVVDINQRSQLSHHPSPEKFSLELRYVQKKKIYIYIYISMKKTFQIEIKVKEGKQELLPQWF